MNILPQKIIFPQSQIKIVKKFPQLYNFRSGKVSKFALFWKKLSRFALFREKRQIITFLDENFPLLIFFQYGEIIFDPFAYEITLAWSMALIHCVKIYLSLFIKARFARFAGSFQQVSFILEIREKTCMTVIKIYKHWPKFFCVRSILTLKNVISDNNSIQNDLIPKFNAKQFINGLSFNFHRRISLMSYPKL